MRKTMIILLAVLAVVMLASCSVDKGNSEENTMSHNTNQDLEALFQTVCSADDALGLARKSNIPVFELQGCTSGIQDAMIKTSSIGRRMILTGNIIIALTTERIYHSSFFCFSLYTL